MSAQPAIIELQNVDKSFGPIDVLMDISLKVHAGEALCLLGDNGAGKSTLIKVLSGAVPASSGDIYVADGYGSSFVVVYDRNGRYKTTFGGGMTEEAGKLNCPHGIAIDARSGQEEVLVADRANNRLQYFDLDGNHLRFAEGVDLPCHFDFGADGVLLIPDLAARVTLMDRDNQVIAHLGEGLPDYRERRLLHREHFLPGKFVCPHGACFDHDGNIFVAEWVEIGRLTKLARI